MQYGDILRRALTITWKKKVLWGFGILAALFGGSFSLPSPNLSNMVQYRLNDTDIGMLRRFFRGTPLGPAFWQRSATIILALLGFAVVFGLILAIVRIIVHYTSVGALIGLVDRSELERSVTFREGLHIGWRRFLRLFAINLLIGLASGIATAILVFILIIAGVIIEIPAILAFTGGDRLIPLGVLWTIGVVFIFVALLLLLACIIGLIVTAISELSARACVLENEGVFAAIASGTDLFRDHLKQVTVVWMLLGVIDIIWGIVIAVIVLMAMAMIVAPTVLLAQATRAIWIGLVVAVPLLLVLFAGGTFVSGLYFVFRSSTWTLAYRELTLSTER